MEPTPQIIKYSDVDAGWEDEHQHHASTYIDSKTKTRHDLIDWVLTMLGHPLVQVELTEAQLNTCILNATEKYTKYATFKQQPLILSLKDYIPGEGIDLSEYNVAAVYGYTDSHDNMMGMGTDMIWGLPNALLQSGAYPFFGNGGIGGGWTTFHLAQEWLELSQRMRGSGRQYSYNKDTHMLKLYPEPKDTDIGQESILLQVEQIPEDTFLYQNEYVKRLTLAYAKILLGTIRKKFGSVQLIGGGQLDTSIGEEGREELSQIMEQIRQDEAFNGYLYIG